MRAFAIYSYIVIYLKMLNNRLEKFVYPVKLSAWLYASALKNFAMHHFFNVSIVFSWERYDKTDETT